MSGEDEMPSLEEAAIPDLEGGEEEVPPQLEVSEEKRKVPVTIITGFLGSGKTTLLNYILKENHGKKIAVIENEFGEELGIESAMVVEGPDGTVFEECFQLSNGCICCSVRDDLINTIMRIMETNVPFDYVVVETTGLADPGPIASIFWLDSALETGIYLDSIVTVIDAKYCKARLTEKRKEGSVNEAVRQVAFADTILLNKTDLVDAPTLDENMALIKSINSTATIHQTQKSEIDLSLILDANSFDITSAKSTMEALAAAPPPSEEGTGQLLLTHSSHDVDIGTVFFMLDRPLDFDKVRRHIAELLYEYGTEEAKSEEEEREAAVAGKRLPARQIYRMKGLLKVEGGGGKPYVLQAVGELFDLEVGDHVADDGTTESKFVVIGRGLRRKELLEGFQACMVEQK
mmetsp:Transcript_31915/g.83306  ORF Transcript_31915/g.83306 Transcript_31915/m.83306 type:complete len:404 (-) Transcript_31915:40-1251(-)